MAYGFENYLDEKWLGEKDLELYHIERKQTFPAWNAAAEYASNLLKNEGFTPETVVFPADGKMTYQDKTSPIGWDVSYMRMTLKTPVNGISDPVIADFEREPLEVVKHSVSLPEGGVDARIVPQSRMRAGEDVRGAFVLLDPDARPHKEDLKMLLDLGAYGWVSDYVENPLVHADGVAWLNAGTEHNSWHVPADERDFIGFQITPINGFYLRAACKEGDVIVHVESDAHRYVSTLPVVTTLLPGEEDRELWLVAHLYEPLIDDNSSGVVGCVAVLKALRRMAQEGKFRLKYGVRVVFCSEMYGAAAYIEHIGDARKKAIGAINMDGLNASSDKCSTQFRAIEGPDFNGGSREGGFVGNVLLHEVTREYKAAHPEIEFFPQPHRLSDDCCIGDSTVGIPTVWLYHTREGLHHNSKQDESLMDMKAFVKHLSICSEWICRMVSLTKEDILGLLPYAVKHAQSVLDDAAKMPIRKGTDPQQKMDFLYARECARIYALRAYADIPEIDEAAAALVKPQFDGGFVSVEAEKGAVCSWYDYCARFTFTRLTRGFPHDLAKLPPDERFRLPGDILEVDLSSVISRVGEGLTMQDALREVEWDKGSCFTEAEVKSYLLTFVRLHFAGYLGLKYSDDTTLETALRRLGIAEGDTVAALVSMDELGYTAGGAKGALESLRAAVGEKGCVMLPAFANSRVITGGSVCHDPLYRPYDTRPNGALRDRTLGQFTIEREIMKTDGVQRSGHLTHEWAAIGADAEELVGGIKRDEAPFGKNSPLAKACAHDGKLVLMGVSACENPFIPFIESCAGSKDFTSAVARYIDCDGELCAALVEGVPMRKIDCEAFWQAMIGRGLKIEAAPYGRTMLYCVDMRSLTEIGTELLTAIPYNSAACCAASFPPFSAC